jgi:hypothetical protein
LRDSVISQIQISQVAAVTLRLFYFPKQSSPIKKGQTGMGRYFMQDTPLASIERLMMQCPNSVRDGDETINDYESKRDGTSQEQSRSLNPAWPFDSSAEKEGRMTS